LVKKFLIDKKEKKEMKKYNRNIDVIIPAYNVPDEILFRCLASIACQDIV
jgi:cellulose synthase/poly-beta-1,6-N-acetylglucosamine synthase-like glycosyltransferase